MYCKGCKYLPLGSQECYSCSAGSNYVPNELESLKKENAKLKKKLCLMRKYIYGSYDLEYKEMQLQHIDEFGLELNKRW